MDVIVTVLILMAFIIGGIGVAVVIWVLAWPADTERQDQQQRFRQAEQVIVSIAQWEQDAILATLQRRMAEGQPGDWPLPPSRVVDGEVLGSDDELGRPRW